LSLWNQQGSTVIRGNLLVIPVAGSLLYIEPLYLQSTNGRIPELQRVIVATGDNVKMAENLGLALAALFGDKVLKEPGLADLATFGRGGQPITTTEGAGSATGEADTVNSLIAQANKQYQQAQQDLRAGNWASYGEQMTALQQTLNKLAQISGVQLAPVATPQVQGSPAVTATSEAQQ